MGIGIWRDFKDLQISEWDDYMIHQISAPIERVGYEDPYFMERLVFCAHNAEGTLHILTAGGIAPNMGLMQGGIAVRYKDIQRNIRCTRYINNDRTRFEIGPLSYKILEPLKRWGIYLAENDYGIGCSLEFEGRSAPWCHPVASQEQRAEGKEVLLQMHTHFDQPGYLRGTIIFEDQQFNADGFSCFRDRTWAIRHPGWDTLKGFYLWIQAHFSNCSLCLFYYELGGNNPHMGAGAFLGDDGSVTDIVDMRHRIDFMSTARDYTKMEFVLVDSNGKERHLTATPISPQLYMAGCGYDDRLAVDHGEPLHVEGERWVVSPPLGIDDRRFGMNQRDTQFELDGEPGTGLIESGFYLDPNGQYEPTL